MNTHQNPVKKTRVRLAAAAASIAIAVTIGTAPVLADAVRVDNGQQMPSFADVVEKVSPAVVSVRVKEKIEPASDTGADLFGGDQDNLPDPLKKFFKDF